MAQTQISHQSSAWRKANYSMSDGACVEVGVREGCVVVRDSTRPAGNVLAFATTAWTNFLTKQKNGK